MHLLGRNLWDHKRLKVALTSFFGIGQKLAPRLLARLQIHPEAKVSDLTEPQITALSAYLSAPSSSTRPPSLVLATPAVPPQGISLTTLRFPNVVTAIRPVKEDPLDMLKIETDLKRSMLADIARLRRIGSYRGRRHASGFPVRGQRTNSGGKTARRLNKVERRFGHSV